MGKTVDKLRALIKRNSGVTLMEVLIVIAILGALAAVVIPRFTGLYGRGETEAAEAELHIVREAVGVYMMENNGVAVGRDDVQLGYSDSDYGEYLSTSTSYRYTIEVDGTTTQGAAVE